MELENLTQYQRLAVEGEVALLLSKAKHDDELLYFIYLSLKEMPVDFAQYALEVAKNLITLPEYKIDRVALEVATEQFPKWLWLDKTISDIKLSRFSSEGEFSPVRVHVDKKQTKQMLIRSAFLRFCREVYVNAGSLSYELCEKVLEDRELDFLAPVAVSFMKSYMWEGAETPKTLTDDTFALMFDLRNMLSYSNEQRALSELIKCEEDSDYAQAKMEEIKNKLSKKGKPPVVIKVNVNDLSSKNNDLTKGEDTQAFNWNEHTKELSENLMSEDAIKKLLDEVISSAMITKKEEKPERYIVSKDYGEERNKATLRVFKTKEEAELFVKQMEEQFPELLSTCKFVISKG